jgi:uncharacterized membrane protein SpoIIM required for sporulation
MNNPSVMSTEKEGDKNLPSFSVQTILFNNAFVYIKIVVYGLFSFGLYSGLFLFYNGYILGNYVALMQDYNIPGEIIAKAVLPHFLEYFSMWLSGAIGLSGIGIITNLMRNRELLAKKQIYFFLRVIGLIVICVVISAIVEVKLSLEFALKALE